MLCSRIAGPWPPITRSDVRGGIALQLRAYRTVSCPSPRAVCLFLPLCRRLVAAESTWRRCATADPPHRCGSSKTLKLPGSPATHLDPAPRSASPCHAPWSYKAVRPRRLPHSPEIRPCTPTFTTARLTCTHRMQPLHLRSVVFQYIHEFRADATRTILRVPLPHALRRRLTLTTATSAPQDHPGRYRTPPHPNPFLSGRLTFLRSMASHKVSPQRTHG